jgi:D-glycero-D-manno-heptose 1,7-bisphosphate phosphatase
MATGHSGGGWIPLGKAARGGRRPAVFIDKDGTLIHDVPYNVDPEKVRLRSDAGMALTRLRRAGYLLILVTNQPGVARGLYGEADLIPVWERLALELAAWGTGLEGIYYCPHHPEGSDPRYAYVCDCRKPQPGLLIRAAADHGIDLSRSWMIGDILDDVEAGHRAGCRTALLDVGSETEWLPGPRRQPHLVAPSLLEAASGIVAQTLRPEAAPWTA